MPAAIPGQNQRTTTPNFSQTATLALISTTATSTPNPAYERARLRMQCLDIAETKPDEWNSSGVVILDRVNDIDLSRGNTLLLDMTTGMTTRFDMEHEGQLDHIVSPDGTRMAFNSFIFDDGGTVTKDEWVVANAKGERLVAVPVEEDWLTIPGWLDSEHLIINLSAGDEKEIMGKEPATMLVLNPFTGERRILEPELPNFASTLWDPVPYWYGWSSVLYDPTTQFAVYPYLFGHDLEHYTYALWDVSNRKIIVSLENSFAHFSSLRDTFPPPKWSPDGSRFAFRGMIVSDDKAKYELYEVGVSGQVRQLTNLDSVALVQDANFSWSPDGRYLAIFLNDWGALEEEPHIALLDTQSLEIVDYCLKAKYHGKGYGRPFPPAPIWSPDSKQILLVDWYERDHQGLLLIDIERNTAITIPENMQPMGWMKSP